MSSTDQAPEPTMDEILASIRRIIADEPNGEKEDNGPAITAMPDPNVADDIANALGKGQEDEEPEDDILDLTQDFVANDPVPSPPPLEQSYSADPIPPRPPSMSQEQSPEQALFADPVPPMPQSAPPLPPMPPLHSETSAPEHETAQPHPQFDETAIPPAMGSGEQQPPSSQFNSDNRMAMGEGYSGLQSSPPRESLGDMPPPPQFGEQPVESVPSSPQQTSAQPSPDFGAMGNPHEPHRAPPHSPGFIPPMAESGPQDQPDVTYTTVDSDQAAGESFSDPFLDGPFGNTEEPHQHAQEHPHQQSENFADSPMDATQVPNGPAFQMQEDSPLQQPVPEPPASAAANIQDSPAQSPDTGSEPPSVIELSGPSEPAPEMQAEPEVQEQVVETEHLSGNIQEDQNVSDPAMADDGGMEAAASVPSPQDGDMKSLEQSVKELLRPMLRDWLDNNMPGIIKGVVKEEFDSSNDKS